MAKATGFEHETFDIACVGAGPANLAIAAAVDDVNRRCSDGERLSCVLLEQQPSFGWHAGMLLEGTTMQVTFLKDLATMRDPTSPFTFLNYLHVNGRMADFANLQTFFPERVEFTDYFRWVSEQVDAETRYGCRVVGIQPNDSSTSQSVRFLLDYECDGSIHRVGANNVVVSTGLAPSLPAWAHASERVFHNSGFRFELPALEVADSSPEFLVVGGGQSAAEIVSHLHRSFPSSICHWVFRGYGVPPADDSPFVNQIFDPAAVDECFSASPSVRSELRKRHSTTNYSCVDGELLDELYQLHYRELVTGDHRLQIHRVAEVTAVQDQGQRVSVELAERLSGTTALLTVDAVICATGFFPRGLGEFDGAVPEEWLGAEVDRYHRPLVGGRPVVGLHVLGVSEGTHGLTSTLLSNSAVRAGEVVESIRQKDSPIEKGQDS